MISRWHSRIAGIALGVVASTVGASTYKDGDSMKHGNAGVAVTHCLGRHLIDLPPGSSVDARFIVGGAKISTRKGMSMPEFREIVTARAAALTLQPHSEAASRFVGRSDLADERVLLTSWLSPNSVHMYLTELYGFFPAGGVMQVFTGDQREAGPPDTRVLQFAGAEHAVPGGRADSRRSGLLYRLRTGDAQRTQSGGGDDNDQRPLKTRGDAHLHVSRDRQAGH
jgi:hypothetical protein